MNFTYKVEGGSPTAFDGHYLGNRSVAYFRDLPLFEPQVDEYGMPLFYTKTGFNPTTLEFDGEYRKWDPESPQNTDTSMFFGIPAFYNGVDPLLTEIDNEDPIVNPTKAPVKRIGTFIGAFFRGLGQQTNKAQMFVDTRFEYRDHITNIQRIRPGQFG